MSPELPEYVERGGASCYRPPYACRNTRLLGFVVRGDRARMQERLVDPVLNAPSRQALGYRVAAPWILVTFAWVDDGRCVESPHDALGSTKEGSCTVWVITARRGPSGLELRFFVPYIVVDNPWSMAAGREVYGFPKSLGTLSLSGPMDRVEAIAASSWAVARPSPDAVAVEQPLVSVRRVPDGPADSPLGSFATKLRWVRELFDGAGPSSAGVPSASPLELARSWASLAGKRTVPSVFLKQFRDAADGSRACYQAIVEVEAKVDRIRSLRPLEGAFELTVAELATHPLQSDLGLHSPTTQVAGAFWADYDFTIGAGREVWSASARP